MSLMTVLSHIVLFLPLVIGVIFFPTLYRVEPAYRGT